MIFLLLVISDNINGHLHDNDLPGHERDRQAKKVRKVMVKLPWGLCPPLQVWAQKSLPGRVLAGMPLADGGVNRGSDNPQPGGGGDGLRY